MTGSNKQAANVMYLYHKIVPYLCYQRHHWHRHWHSVVHFNYAVDLTVHLRCVSFFHLFDNSHHFIITQHRVFCKIQKISTITSLTFRNTPYFGDGLQEQSFSSRILINNFFLLCWWNYFLNFRYKSNIVSFLHEQHW